MSQEIFHGLYEALRETRLGQFVHELLTPTFDAKVSAADAGSIGSESATKSSEVSGDGTRVAEDASLYGPSGFLEPNPDQLANLEPAKAYLGYLEQIILTDLNWMGKDMSPEEFAKWKDLLEEIRSAEGDLKESDIKFTLEQFHDRLATLRAPYYT